MSAFDEAYCIIAANAIAGILILAYALSKSKSGKAFGDGYGICKNEKGGHCFKAVRYASREEVPPGTDLVDYVESLGVWRAWPDQGVCPYPIWRRKECQRFVLNRREQT